MNKKIFIIGSLILIGLLAGCDQIPQIKQLKEAYLQTRVVQIVTQMATKATTEEPKVVPSSTALPPTAMPTETLPSFPLVATETPAPPQPTQAPNFTPIPTSIPPTATPTVAPTFTPISTVVSSDPAIYLGKVVWKDTFDDNKGWAVDTDDYPVSPLLMV